MQRLAQIDTIYTIRLNITKLEVNSGVGDRGRYHKIGTSNNPTGTGLQWSICLMYND